jgi:hypothetical protein
LLILEGLTTPKLDKIVDLVDDSDDIWVVGQMVLALGHIGDRSPGISKKVFP